MKLSLNKRLAADVLLATAAATRWDKEQGGATFNGMAIATDSASQAKIAGAVDYLAKKDPGATVSFKATNGFVELDLTAMTAVAMAVGDHVQACFALERTVAEAIAAGAITTEAQVIAAFA